MTAEKVMENRLRRTAARRGYRLEKSRRRDPHAVDFGGYMLIDERSNAVVCGAGTFPYSATLDDIDDYLESPRQTKGARKATRTKK